MNRRRAGWKEYRKAKRKTTRILGLLFAVALVLSISVIAVLDVREFWIQAWVVSAFVLTAIISYIICLFTTRRSSSPTSHEPHD